MANITLFPYEVMPRGSTPNNQNQPHTKETGQECQEFSFCSEKGAGRRKPAASIGSVECL